MSVCVLCPWTCEKPGWLNDWGIIKRGRLNRDAVGYLTSVLTKIPLGICLGVVKRNVKLFLVFLMNLHTDFQGGSIKLHYTNDVYRLIIHLSLQEFLFLHILMIAILTKVRWDLSVVLICIFLVAKDAEHFPTYSLVICTSFKNRLFNSFAYLFIGR